MLRFVATNDARFQVFDQGQGTAILFAHGFPLDHTMWTGQLAAFAKTHRVIAPDLRGFGASDVTPGAVTMEQMADDCAAILDALGIAEPITFCGLSMGGYVGWQFVRKYAARLSRLVLCDTRAVPDTPEAAEGRRKMAAHVRAHGTEAVATAMLPKLFGPTTAAQHPEVIEATRQVILAARPEGVAAAQQGMAIRPDARPLLATIRVPVLVIVGEHDAISPPAEMQEFAAAIPGARFTVIRDAGHMAPLEQPAMVNNAMAEFLLG